MQPRVPSRLTPLGNGRRHGGGGGSGGGGGGGSSSSSSSSSSKPELPRGSRSCGQHYVECERRICVHARLRLQCGRLLASMLLRHELVRLQPLLLQLAAQVHARRLCRREAHRRLRAATGGYGQPQAVTGSHRRLRAATRVAPARRLTPRGSWGHKGGRRAPVPPRGWSGPSHADPRSLPVGAAARSPPPAAASPDHRHTVTQSHRHTDTQTQTHTHTHTHTKSSHAR